VLVLVQHDNHLAMVNMRTFPYYFVFDEGLRNLEFMQEPLHRPTGHVVQSWRKLKKIFCVA
jgi:hypothetical protein